jgi:hypothetical protein
MDEEKKDDIPLERIKEHLIEDLQDQYARGILDMDEYEELVKKTREIENKYDLARLADDLPDLQRPEDTAGEKKSSAGQHSSHRRPENDHHSAADRPHPRELGTVDSIVSVMGENRRSGRWKPAKQIKVFTLMADLNIDFTHAEFSSNTVYIDFFSIMSDVDIIIPPHVQVEFSGTPVLSSHKDKTIKVGGQNGPVLRINGVSFMADVVVKESDIE